MDATRHVTVFGEARYSIWVRGIVAPDWSYRFAGLHICVVDSGRYAATELSGRLADQAALLGVLTDLYNLGFPLLSVERIAAS